MRFVKLTEGTGKKALVNLSNVTEVTPNDTGIHIHFVNGQRKLYREDFDVIATALTKSKPATQK